jgi:hypothetical protein
MTDALMPDQDALVSQCDSATSGPTCVFKTWAACHLWHEPQWCGLVGQPGVTFDNSESDEPLEWQPPPKPTEPWTLDLRDPKIQHALGRVIGVRAVTQGRCHLEFGDLKDVFAGAHQDHIGDQEVMYLWRGTNQTTGEDRFYLREEIFVRLEGDKWQLSGWQYFQEDMQCLWADYQNDPYWEPRCRTFSPVYPWALESEVISPRIDPIP